MTQPINNGGEADKNKPFDRDVFDVIVAACDAPIPISNGGVRARTNDETFRGTFGVFEAGVVSGWPENSTIHQSVNFLLRDDGLWIRPPRPWESSDGWHPLASVERKADAKPVLPFPFDGIDLAMYFVRGPGAFLMDWLVACLEDAGGDIDAATRLMVPVQPHEPVLDEDARRALFEAWRAWERAASSLQRDPLQAAKDSAGDLAFAGRMVRALHSMREPVGTAIAPHVGARSAPGSQRSPTVQQAIAPYVAAVMQAHPSFTAEALHRHMRTEAGGDSSPFSRLTPGADLYCMEASATCGIASVRTALTRYRKQSKGRTSTVEVP